MRRARARPLCAFEWLHLRMVQCVLSPSWRHIVAEGLPACRATLPRRKSAAGCARCAGHACAQPHPNIPPRASSEHCAQRWQAESVTLLQALLRTMGAAMRGQPVLGARCWQQLGDGPGLARMLQQTTVMQTQHAGAALACVLELCSGSSRQPEHPQAATAALIMAKQLGDHAETLRLLTALHGMASQSEGAAVQLSRAGLLLETLRWLLSPNSSAVADAPLSLSLIHI